MTVSTAQPTNVCEVSCIHPEAVATAKSALPGDTCTAEATNFLKLLGDSTRLKILSALNATELCVCDLAAVVGISESAVSHQLCLLRTGRLVAFRKEGRVVYYSLADEHVVTLISSALEHARE